MEAVAAQGKSRINPSITSTLPGDKAIVAFAPYAVPPKPGPTVFMPLHWEEVTKDLTMAKFTITNALARIKVEGDFFKPVLSKDVNIEKVLKALNGEI